MKKILIVLTVLLILIGLVIGYKYYDFYKNAGNVNNSIQTASSIEENEINGISFNLEETDTQNEEELEIMVAILNEKHNIFEFETDNAQEQIENLEETQEVVSNITMPQSTPETTNIVPNTYLIKVNCLENVVTIYKQDEVGQYNTPVKAMICSTGEDTPQAGTYSIDNKYKWLGLVGDVYGQYCTQIIGNILFHSVPYLTRNDPATLEYWEYDKLGTTASAGCVRLTVLDAKWIYDNCKVGTTVEFYSDENPGPLGKPDFVKITEYEDYRNWDPTDPDERNPWLELAEI